MERYKCIKSVSLLTYDEEERITDKYKEIEKGTEWEYAHDYVSNSDARLYLEEGNSDFDYIDITYDIMEECFERIA